MIEIKPSMVYLIGAGPGAPGLITVRGAELIGRADVILYDGLANPELLVYARSDAQKICVGKHGHGGMWTQKQIDDEVIRFAKSGKSVARLKGGDTAVFARTAEEVDRLIDEGIPYEIVPGITAALAVNAFTGIPLTHRDWSSAVALVTGQMQPSDGNSDSEESLDWNALAHFPGTLVLYMGVTTAQHWSNKLIAFGKPASTPVALVRRCSWPDQEVIRCELGNVAATIASTPGLRPPMISIVGDVIRMTKTMEWFSIRPWFGKHVWVTSPDRTGKKLGKKFADLGAHVHQHPVMRVDPPLDWPQIDATLTHLAKFDRAKFDSAKFDWIVFSSIYGVDSFFCRMQELGLDARSLHASKIAAVGTGTAAAIAKYFVVCDLVPQTSSAEALAELLRHECRGKRFLFVRNPDGETSAMEQLAASGAIVEALDIYQQSLLDTLPTAMRSFFEQGETCYITATSKNISRQTVQLLGEHSNRQTWLSLSPAITETLHQLGCTNVLTSREASFESLAELLPSAID